MLVGKSRLEVMKWGNMPSGTLGSIGEGGLDFIKHES
jgi:hypothetical protein